MSRIHPGIAAKIKPGACCNFAFSPGKMCRSQMLVSVIIPALNEEGRIGTCLLCLAAQTLSKDQFEVIVVDNGSTDRTSQVAWAFRDRLNVKVLHKTNSTIAGLRNHGAETATGEVLAFLDADCFTDPNWLSLALCRAPIDGIWGAHYRLTEDATWVSRIWNTYQARDVDGGTSFIPSSDLFIHAADFRALAGFNTGVLTSEDVEICSRARTMGMAVTADKELAVRHAHSPRTLREFYRKNRWHGLSVLPNFIRNLPSTRHLGLIALSLYTLIMFWSLMASIAAGLFFPSAWPIVFLIALIAPAALLAAWKTRGSSPISTVLLLILYETYFLSRAAALLRSDWTPRVIGSRSAQPRPLATRLRKPFPR